MEWAGNEACIRSVPCAARGGHKPAPTAALLLLQSAMLGAVEEAASAVGTATWPLAALARERGDLCERRPPIEELDALEQQQEREQPRCMPLRERISLTCGRTVVRKSQSGGMLPLRPGLASCD